MSDGDDDLGRAVTLVYRITLAAGGSRRRAKRLCAQLRLNPAETPRFLARRIHAALSSVTDGALEQAVAGALLGDAVDRLPRRQRETLRAALDGRSVAWPGAAVRGMGG